MAARRSVFIAAASSLFVMTSVHAQDETPPSPEAPAAETQEASATTAPPEVAPGTAETVPTIPLPEEPAAPPPELAEGSGGQQLEEIVVTATKRRQTAREIPNTINVVTGEKLELQGARELQDFVDQIPGLQMQELAV